jgi:hypothetical protein
MNILDYIPRGRENAVTRRDLTLQLNLPDRTIRNMIEEARREGALIINDGSGVGYYVSDNLQDLHRQYRMNNNRAMSVLVQQKHLRRRIKELEEVESDGRAPDVCQDHH